MAIIAVGLCIAIFAYSVILHEVAHAWVADKLGDYTARAAGRISLNPLVHIDPIQTIVMPLIIWHSCGFAFGGAKPVPINPFMFRRPREGMMLTALAGPLTNILLALALTACYVATSILAGAAGVHNSLADEVLPFGIRINVVLACFNLVPIPPLDGSRLVAYLLPPRLAEAYESLEQFGIFILMAILIAAPTLLYPAYYAMKFAYTFLVDGGHVLAEAVLTLIRR